jgi:hypothetical protein
VRRSDVQRSARRWLALALADDAWSLEDERIEVADDQRPVGIVEATTGLAVAFARSSVPQGDVQKRVTVTMTLYPETTGTGQECGRRARALVDAITDAWTIGLVIPPVGAVVEVPLYPAALPLWDFGALADDVTVQGAPLSYAMADSVTIRDVGDPLDDRRWTVVCELRLTWWSGGRSRWGSAPETRWGRLIRQPGVTK